MSLPNRKSQLETEEEADTGSEVDDEETDPADIPLPSTPPVVT